MIQLWTSSKAALTITACSSQPWPLDSLSYVNGKRCPLKKAELKSDEAVEYMLFYLPGLKDSFLYDIIPVYLQISRIPYQRVPAVLATEGSKPEHVLFARTDRA